METKISKIPAAVPLAVERQNFRTDLPPLEVGEEVRVVIKREREIKKEGRGSNTTFIVGEIIALKNPQRISYTFVVWDNKFGSTTKFCYHSPTILGIEKLGKKVKRRSAKTYYLVRQWFKKKGIKRS